MVSALKKLEAGGKAAECVKEHRVKEDLTEERSCSEEATKENDWVDSSCFCIHCSENSCFVDMMFDAAKSYCDHLGEGHDHPLSTTRLETN
jgi:hypothetical protein